MEEQIISIYCLCDDFIHSKRFIDQHNVKVSTPEIMMNFIVAMRFFYGNLDLARRFLCEHGYIRKNFTLSCLNKRVHKINSNWWHEILEFIQSWGKRNGLPSEYIVDVFPVSVCRNIRIQRCRIYQGENFRGFNVSKKEYFYGIKATVITTREGCPVRVMLCPGREHDIVPFRLMDLKLPKGSELYGDSAYTDYEHEDQLLKEHEIRLIADRKANTTRPMNLEDYVNLKYIRGTIETTLGVISRLLPRKIHAVTSIGFELKILGFVLAYATNFI